MAFYVDGFVVPVPRRKVPLYRSMARKAGRVFIEHGALQFVENMGDDVKPGKLTSFPQSVKLKPGEVVFFSWITYRSRRHRDAVNAKVIADPRLASMIAGKGNPFDSRRMMYGGFKSVVTFGGA
jgi:uncharacterized protein YbaA (DUF1428 family)